jgi:hypothetical protein
MNKERYLDSEMHKFCKSFYCNTAQFHRDDSNFTNYQGTEDRESWLGTLHLVTLKHSRNFDFSICDKIFEPLELVHIAYLLSAAESISISANSAGAINLQSVTQNKVKQKVAQYNKDASNFLSDEGSHDVKEVTDDSRDIPALIQLQIIVRQIFLRFPENAYDALLVLNEMQRESSRIQTIEGERISIKREKSGGGFLDICVSVVHLLSLCDICSDTSNSFQDSDCDGALVDGIIIATKGLIYVVNEDQRSRNYRAALQDSLLKVLLEAEDVMGVAALLCRWSRIEDLKVFTDRVWGSIQFILGEHEQEEEYYSFPKSGDFSDSARRTIRVRRPVPLFESILEIAHLDHLDGFSGRSEEDALGVESESGEGDADVSTGKVESVREDCQTSLTTEEIKVEEPSVSSTSKSETSAATGLSPLPANSNQLLRRRLLQFTAIQQLTADAAVPS